MGELIGIGKPIIIVEYNVGRMKIVREGSDIVHRHVDYIIGD